LRIAAAFFIVSVTAVVVGAFAFGSTASADDTTVDAGSNWFCSSQYDGGVCDTNITAGDTVTWNFIQGFHTATQCGADFSPCPLSGGFDSDIVDPGLTYSRTFDTAGTYWYYCALHPSDMKGRIIVAEATPSPTAAPTDGATAAPTQAATPAGIPATGGPPGESGVATGALLALGAGLLIAGTGGFVLAPPRRRA